MTQRQQKARARAVRTAADEAVRRIRAETEEEAKPCHRPFCTNPRPHACGSGECFVGTRTINS